MNGISQEIVNYGVTLLIEPALLNVPNPKEQIETELVEFVVNVDYLRKGRNLISTNYFEKAFPGEKKHFWSLKGLF